MSPYKGSLGSSRQRAAALKLSASLNRAGMPKGWDASLGGGNRVFIRKTNIKNFWGDRTTIRVGEVRASKKGLSLSVVVQRGHRLGGPSKLIGLGRVGKTNFSQAISRMKPHLIPGIKRSIAKKQYPKLAKKHITASLKSGVKAANKHHRMAVKRARSGTIRVKAHTARGKGGKLMRIKGHSRKRGRRR